MSDDALQPSSALTERYRVLFPVGKGGMGTVEVALEQGAGSFRRIVALKRMLGEVGRVRRNVDMFLREAGLAKMLNHPNVVHAFEAGEANGHLYISMEYVEGEPLSNLIKKAKTRTGALEPELAAYVIAEICDGLHAAHELRDADGKLLNVVHRDLSPHNVMVAYEGHVKVLDFGVAKVDDELKVTHTGEVKGKTAYMAPEQALGEALDRRSDLFSVGAVLYECLTGERMWGQASDIQLMRRLALEEPPRLEVALPDAPRAIVDLYTRLVERKPEDRPASARDVSSALRAYISTSPNKANDRVLRGRMFDLFGKDAAAKRKELEDALSGVVDPDSARELKHKLSLSTAPLTESERRMIAALKPPPRVEAAPPATPVIEGPSDTVVAVDPLSETVLAPVVRSSRRLVGALLLGIVLIGVGGAAIASLTRQNTDVRNDQMDAGKASAGATTSSAPANTQIALPPALASAIAGNAGTDAPDAATSAKPPASSRQPNAQIHPRPHPSAGRPEIDPNAL